MLMSVNDASVSAIPQRNKAGNAGLVALSEKRLPDQ
jgi:hypothetical protein